jgi:hypothetical protein
MIPTKLILVDGLPGSGKSTTAQFIALQLERNAISAEWFYELEHVHPIHAFHVWSREGPAKFIETTTNNWHKFVEQSHCSDRINILESTLFQSTIRLLLQSDLPHSMIREYACATIEIIQDLNPVLFYFQIRDIAAAFQEICEKRKKIWEQYFIQVIGQSLYGKRRQLNGFDGVLTFFREYQQLTTDLFSQFTIHKLALEDAQADWTACYHTICEFLQIPFKPEPVLPPQQLELFAGQYQDEQTRLEINIILDGPNLFIRDLLWPKSRLILKQRTTFYVEACPLELTFERDDSGAIRTMKIVGHPGWKFYGKTLIKTQ